MRGTELILNPRRSGRLASASASFPFSCLDARAAALARRFHASLPGYAPTPLRSLDRLAAALGLGRVLVKDESRRFGLNAFKALGASWAVARLLARRLDLPLENLSAAALRGLRARQQNKELLLLTATDGNHGRGLAWTARQLGLRASVFMPKGSDPARAEAIRALGAQCEITQCNYDDTVRHAASQARRDGVLVQDTAWPGYEEIPLWIMQGYTTLALEAHEQMREMGTAGSLGLPSHIFLQAGVGSFAAAVLGYFMHACAGTCGRAAHEPSLTAVSVEPHKADCVFQSLRAGDGRTCAVGGSLRTLMAGLACGEVSSLAWPVLRDHLAAAVSCPDRLAVSGMRLLAAPLPGDAVVVSGESGAVTAGLLHWLMRPQKEAGKTQAGNAAALRHALGLNSGSVVLLINTEGDTAPALYRKIVRQVARGT